MTTIHPDPGVIWFSGLGFRPAVWTPPHRADAVDPDRLVPAPDADTAYLAKYDSPTGYAWGTVLWPVDHAAPGGQVAASLAGPVASFTAGPLIPGPWWPPVDYPCRCITQPPDVPPVAPVPVPAAAPLLLAAVVAMALLRRRA